jgi:hypothetical protein
VGDGDDEPELGRGVAGTGHEPEHRASRRPGSERGSPGPVRAPHRGGVVGTRWDAVSSQPGLLPVCGKNI